jgi:hypothetical protein
MFCGTIRPFLGCLGITSQSRSLHRLKPDLITRDATGSAITPKVCVTLRDIDSTFLSMNPSTMRVFRKANPSASSSQPDQCKPGNFYDSKNGAHYVSRTCSKVADTNVVAVAESYAEPYFNFGFEDLLDPMERDPSDMRTKLVTNLKCVLEEL